MKKILFAILLFCTSQIMFAQSNNDNNISDSAPNDVQTNFNKWSIEFGVGGNKPVEPFTDGHSSSSAGKFINFGSPDHFNVGVRYMFNNKFGLKLTGAYDKISNEDITNSPLFDSRSIRASLEGVLNIGRVLNFEDFTSRFGLLVHLGLQGSSFTPKMGLNEELMEYNFGFIYGVTPQFRITDRVTLNTDLSLLSNLRQHFTWDGQSNQLYNPSTNNKNLNGTIYNFSIGLSIALGSNDKHADWDVQESQQTIVQSAPVEIPEVDLSGITARLDELENCMLDNDKDGVNNCIDEEENSAPGAFVNTKGVTIEKPKDGKDGKDGESKVIKEKVKTEIRKGSLLNIFYDVNKDVPNAASAGDVSLIIGYMIANPDSKIRLVGYADTRGGAEKNKALSMRRSKNLTDQIVAKGIARDRVRFDGFGVDKKSANMTKEEMDYARRTEVIVD